LLCELCNRAKKNTISTNHRRLMKSRGEMPPAALQVALSVIQNFCSSFLCQRQPMHLQVQSLRALEWIEQALGSGVSGDTAA